MKKLCVLQISKNIYAELIKHKKMCLRKCESCKYSTKSLYNLQRHQKAAHSAKTQGDYICKTCGYTTGQSWLLKRHQKIKYHKVCKLCGYTAESFWLLRKHQMLKHKDLNTKNREPATKNTYTHQCVICDASFRSLRTLLNHYIYINKL